MIPKSKKTSGGVMKGNFSTKSFSLKSKTFTIGGVLMSTPPLGSRMTRPVAPRKLLIKNKQMMFETSVNDRELFNNCRKAIETAETSSSPIDFDLQMFRFVFDE
jgi:hypothetical protein